MTKAYVRIESIHEEHVTIDLLITDLAIRRYRIDTGRAPDSLEDLVPEFLDVIPIDPFAGRPVTYRKSDDSYLLYSFGLNQKDDGGIASRHDGDIVFLGDAMTVTDW